MSTTVLKRSANSKDSNINSLAQAYQLIENGINNIDNHLEWQRFLAFQARFYRYSFHNTMLIYTQSPNATFVAGFNDWKKHGRFVRKGEKAIKIFAPCLYKKDPQADSVIEDKQKSFILKGFKLVNVFAFEQTCGDDSKLPILINGLPCTNQDAETIYSKTLYSLEIPISEDPELSAKGVFYKDTSSIVIKATISPLQKLKTLIHEYAHYLHHSYHYDEENKSDREVLAESVAYMICHYLNVDTSDYSFPYINSWLNEPEQLKKLASKCHLIASTIIKKLF